MVPIVLRYHPSFATAYKLALRRAPPPDTLGIQLFVSWKNALPALDSYTKSHNGNLCNDVGCGNLHSQVVGSSLLSVVAQYVPSKKYNPDTPTPSSWFLKHFTFKNMNRYSKSRL